MWIDLPSLWIVFLNCLGIPAVHLFFAWGATRLPATIFHPEGGVYRIRSWEKKGRIYEGLFCIRRWKHLLPDAAPWFQGFPKGHLQSTHPDYLRTFSVETCRGECSHWAQLVVLSAFVLWNPFPANFIIVAYSIASNLPCIFNLRFTRLRLQRLQEAHSEVND